MSWNRNLTFGNFQVSLNCQIHEERKKSFGDPCVLRVLDSVVDDRIEFWRISYQGSTIMVTLDERPHICSLYMAYASAGRAVKDPLVVARA